MDGVLHWAIHDENVSLVKTLLHDKEVNPNLQDENGRTPLHWAVADDKPNPTILELLLDVPGINVMLQDKVSLIPATICLPIND